MATRARTAVAAVVHGAVVAAVVGPVAGLGPDHGAVLEADVRAVGLVADADPLTHRTVLELEVDLHASRALAEVDLDLDTGRLFHLDAPAIGGHHAHEAELRTAAADRDGARTRGVDDL